MTQLEEVKQLVSAKKDTAVDLAEKIWGYAELSYTEFKSAAALTPRSVTVVFGESTRRCPNRIGGPNPPAGAWTGSRGRWP